MKRFITSSILFLLLTGITLADEGMWLLPLIQKLNIKRMNEMGFRLTADDIYSINQASLKDAVVALDYGSCTAEMISPDGLLLTNHHCGYEEIQAHSSVDHDYLTLGYWANSMKDELPNPGKTATFLVRMEDVTSKINAAINASMNEDEKSKKIEEVSAQLVEEATQHTPYDATVESFFSHNEYYLIVTETFKDVRLVGAPPSYIGKFGADTDNWMWPRQTGDFSMFRIYCSPDGNPAEYSEKNVPYHPKKFLPVSIKGVKEGDFTMVMGYPGSTQRYLTSYGVNELMTETNPNRIKIRGVKQDIWLRNMMASEKIRIQYASKYSESTNYWKFSIGQQQSFKRQDILATREAQENKFTAWVNADPHRKSMYGGVLEGLKNAYEEKQKYEHAYQYLIECFMNSVEVLNPAVEMLNSASMDSTGKLSVDNEKLTKSYEEFYKNYDLPTDKEVAVAMLDLYRRNVPEEFMPGIYDIIAKKYKGNIQRYVDNLYKKSVFSDKVKAEAFLSKPNLKQIKKDPALQLFGAIRNVYVDNLQPTITTTSAKIDLNERLYMQAIMEMDKDSSFYPDANSTMRMTYGKIGGYRPRDAVIYKYRTTLEGVMEKQDSTNWEFVVGRQLKDLYYKKDYGRYGDHGIMPVCFISDNDITGGNSGSPVINDNGELVGIAFDGNWEGLSGDVQFDAKLQKCICVDIRYVLFVIDKIGGAKRLLDEMKIIE